MGANHGAGAFAIEVEIADVEAQTCNSQSFLVFCKDGAGETVLCIVGNLQGILVGIGFDDGQDGAEDLLLCNARAGRDVCKNCRFDVVSAFAVLDRVASCDKTAFCYALLERDRTRPC